MTKAGEKKDLTVREKTHPETYFDEIENRIDNWFRNPFSLMMPSFAFRDYPKLDELSPSVDVFDDETELVLKAELPGIRKEDLDITITENSITLSGEKKQEKKVEKKDYHWSECSYGSFSRTFRLPDHVNSDAAKASFKEGVLEVRIPKTVEAKQKKITVK